MILLLYCSFLVPFGIAFDSIMDQQQNAAKDNFDFATDVVFMTDICLNFVTAWDNQDVIVRELFLIANTELPAYLVLARLCRKFSF